MYSRGPFDFYINPLLEGELDYRSYNASTANRAHRQRPFWGLHSHLPHSFLHTLSIRFFAKAFASKEYDTDDTKFLLADIFRTTTVNRI